MPAPAFGRQDQDRTGLIADRAPESFTARTQRRFIDRFFVSHVIITTIRTGRLWVSSLVILVKIPGKGIEQFSC